MKPYRILLLVAFLSFCVRTAAETGTEKNTSALLEKAAPFLAEALQDKTMPVREGTTGCEELMSPPLVV